MKRDMDLVRDILLRFEEFDLPPGARIVSSSLDDEMQIEGFSAEQVDYHLRLLADAGYLMSPGISVDGVINGGLSWEGHDFLATVRDPEIWRRTKEGAAKAGSAGIKLLVQLGTAYAKQVAQERLGLHLG